MTDDRWIFVAMLVIGVWYLSHQAGRLDRLHHRIDVAMVSLDALLIRRAAIVAELAAAETVDVLTAALFLDAAHEVLSFEGEFSNARIELENDLSLVVSDAFSTTDDVEAINSAPAASLLLNEFVQVVKRIQLSRRFYAEAVTACINLRRQRAIRLFRLAGHAPMPKTLDFDDSLPFGLRE